MGPNCILPGALEDLSFCRKVQSDPVSPKDISPIAGRMFLYNNYAYAHK